MINAITCPILDSPHTSDYDNMYKGVSKSTFLEPATKNSTKDTSLCPRAA